MYTCSQCQHKTKFLYEDFDRHRETHFSNLSKKDAYIPDIGNYILDFYCPGCRVATTISFDFFVGSKHGESWFTIEELHLKPPDK